MLEKMPAPTMAPTPSTVSWVAPRVRRKVVPVSTSDTACVTGLRRKRLLTGRSAPALLRTAFGGPHLGRGGRGRGSGPARRDHETGADHVLGVVAQAPLADLLDRAGGGLDVHGPGARQPHRAHRAAGLDVHHRPHRLGAQ